MRLVVFKLLTILMLTACQKKRSEPKYAEHKTYMEFLNYLSIKTGAMQSDFEKTSFIRKKAAELIDGGMEHNDVQLIDKNWSTWKAERYYNVFLRDSATVHCGGSAQFLKGIYEDMGYKATTYDIGCAGTISTHQLTLVWSGVAQGYIIQDAFFNTTFTDSLNQPLTFNQLVFLLYEKRRRDIKIVQGEYDYIPNWDTTSLNLVFNKEYISDTIYTYFNKKFLRSDNPIPSYIGFKREYTDIGFGAAYVFKHCLILHGLPNDPLYMFLLPQEHNSIKLNLPPRNFQDR